MRKNIRNTALILVAILGAIMLAYPFLPSEAQKMQTQPQDQMATPTPEQENVLQVVRQNAVASSFYDTVERKEGDWLLTKAIRWSDGGVVTKRGFGPGGISISLDLQKDGSTARVSISEYSSEQNAKLPLEIKISQGAILDCTWPECGDEGQRLYQGISQTENGVGFEGLRFTKGKYFISIYSKSEDVAKRFAGYAIDAITKK
ncbi:MAG TPA: hypothetical protein PKC65_14360 [Pyrinomonadaceae bacterium]|nr:hypothetical protein [Pyrinomonadaceae bacterium]